MITPRIGLNRIVGSLVLLLLAWGGNVRANEATALELVKLGNDYVSKESRDKIVQIRSEKSIGGLSPTIWYIVYYDADATFKATEVKFGAGKKMKVSRPLRMLEPVTGDNKILDRAKIKVDSDRAIRVATSEPLLKPLTLSATQVWLQRSDAGPVWKVRLWAAKLRKPTDDADIGDVYISAEDGKVVRSNLHINRVD